LHTFSTEIKADCKVSEWSEWGGNFGFGQQLRTRNVTQNPIGTGNQCPNLIENRYIGKMRERERQVILMILIQTTFINIKIKESVLIRIFVNVQ
jgi:hypothetical protein